MKYFFYIIGITASILLLGYQYLNHKMISSQEAEFEELASMPFDESPRNFPDSIRMADDQFWQLIADAKAKHPDDFYAQMDVLRLELSALTNKEIIGFEATLREKVIELWSYKVKALYQILFGNYLSRDGFIYFRFWIISHGQEFYQLAITNPDKLAGRIQPSYDGEKLMVVADEAFELKNGADAGLEMPRDAAHAVHYDFGNYRMTGPYISPDDFKKVFPLLSEKF